jgi:Mg/Co/Ni transporter MgtE
MEDYFLTKIVLEEDEDKFSQKVFGIIKSSWHWLRMVVLKACLDVVVVGKLDHLMVLWTSMPSISWSDALSTFSSMTHAGSQEHRNEVDFWQ